MPVVQFTHAIAITPASVTQQTATTLEWDSNARVVRPPQGEVTLNDEGLVGFGAGRGFSGTGDTPNFLFNGFTIDAEGTNAAGETTTETYAIFINPTTGAWRIPYNQADHDIGSLANGGITMDTTSVAVQVFNCFATGTTILTPDGERAIETLQPGDRVMTHDGRSTPAIWVARQTVANPRFVELGRKPVRIDAGALGPDLPNRPLTVTADHALLFGDMLVNAGTLAEDGTPVRFLPLSEMPTKFVWWHVELENHEVVLANGGVPAESFIDYVGRSGFDNYDEYLALAGADRLIPEMPFARLSARRLLPANGLRGLPAIARRPLIAAPRKTAA